MYDVYESCMVNMSSKKKRKQRAAGFEPASPGCEADAEPIELESLYMLSTMNESLIFGYI